ncbi:hypothetical protein LSH36_836g01011 [Paralvinella palmiformis]|uniref:G-protein coupled receptors family 1 profile domain-containing protein n=1 Tax=Paralvinella palmiformis TaxID=53620 RepID=A0AAD9IYV7_9ANNE|nr:hypothetical protein LSH36_836g01011 [Paralvinella palmiformis]
MYPSTNAVLGPLGESAPAATTPAFWIRSTPPNGSQYEPLPDNGIQVVCNATTLSCRYENPYNLTEFRIPEDQCPEVPFYLICHGAYTVFTEIVYGYVSPMLVLFTIITNITMSLVLLMKNMRSPTNTLLMAMALSDMFTGIWPVPCFIYFYTLGHYRDFVPYDWCFVHEVMTEYVPTIFHTASIWLTVALAVQRYIYVCHSMKAKRWCTISNAIKVVIVIYLVAICTQCTRFFEWQYIRVRAQSLLDPGREIVTCRKRFTPFVVRYMHIYFNLYYWIRVIFIHLIPCTSLIVLNSILIAAMRSAQERREQLLRQNRRSECRRLKEANCTTLLLVAVVGLFLLVEFPLAILLILLIVENTFDVALMSKHERNQASLLINLIILLSYPLNFFIYCGMSRQFRETFKRLFVGGLPSGDRDGQSQYISLATENGGAKNNATTACNTRDTLM